MSISSWNTAESFTNLIMNAGYPLVNVYITMDNHHFWWVIQLFLWQFSIAFCMFARPGMWFRLHRFNLRWDIFWDSRILSWTIAMIGWLPIWLCIRDCSVVWNMFFSPIQLGRIIPTDFHIFQTGWNHQPGDFWWLSISSDPRKAPRLALVFGARCPCTTRPRLAHV